MDSVIPIIDGQLYALSNPVHLDGRFSWFPRDVRGFAPINIYVLLAEDSALLIDTGLSIHEEAVISELKEILGARTRLSIFFTRVGEFYSMSNTLAVLENFDVEAVYGPPRSHNWVNIRTKRLSVEHPSSEQLWSGINQIEHTNGMTIQLGPQERRPLQVFTSPLRLLPTYWVYDPTTCALFTSDSFTHVFRATENGPWMVTSEDQTSDARLEHHLLGTRYWWLSDAHLDPIIAQLLGIIVDNPIEVIAPSYGGVIAGSAAVNSQWDLLLATMHDLGAESTIDDVLDTGPCTLSTSGAGPKPTTGLNGNQRETSTAAPADSAQTENPLPREIVPGLFWLGGCLENPWEGSILHSYNSVYLLRGQDRAMIIECGHPQDLDVIEAQLALLTGPGAPPVEYIFATHQETPHSSGLARLLEQYPQAVFCGDTSDYHLIFPGCEERLRSLHLGDELDLGGTRFRIVEPVVKDLNTTLWGYDTSRQILFPGDGFAYSHLHQAGQCGHVAEEVPNLPIEQMSRLFAEFALYWMRFRDVRPVVQRLEALVLDELDVRTVAPTHGLPITDIGSTFPRIIEGLQRIHATT